MKWSRCEETPNCTLFFACTPTWDKVGKQKTKNIERTYLHHRPIRHHPLLLPPLPLLLRSRVHSRNLLQETGGWCRVGTLLVSGITRGESTALEKLVVESIVISQWNKQKGINSIGEFSRRTSTYPYLLLPLPYHNHPLPPLPYHHHHCPLAAYPHKR